MPSTYPQFITVSLGQGDKLRHDRWTGFTQSEPYQHQELGWGEL